MTTNVNPNCLHPIIFFKLSKILPKPLAARITIALNKTRYFEIACEVNLLWVVKYIVEELDFKKNISGMLYISDFNRNFAISNYLKENGASYKLNYLFEESDEEE